MKCDCFKDFFVFFIFFLDDNIFFVRVNILVYLSIIDIINRYERER